MSVTCTFDGESFDPVQDGDRLAGQLDRVRDLMADGEWRTLAQIARAVNASEAAVSARLRDLRKVKFGAHAVERVRVQGGNGLHVYRLTLRPPEKAGWLF